MKIQFDIDLENLKHMVIDMATAVEEMINLSNRILMEKDSSLVEKAYQIEDTVNHMEVEIEQFCVTLIARHQPTATDLRLLVCVIKMINQLERLGDLAINIAKRYNEFMKIPDYLLPRDIRFLVMLSTQMVKESIMAFIRLDAEKARQVCAMDDEVDRLNKKLWKDFIKNMIDSDIDLETGFEMLMAGKQYERIGDCATNIAEEVVYYLKGQNIKHHFAAEELEESSSGNEVSLPDEKKSPGEM